MDKFYTISITTVEHGKIYIPFAPRTERYFISYGDIGKYLKEKYTTISPTSGLKYAELSDEDINELMNKKILVKEDITNFFKYFNILHQTTTYEIRENHFKQYKK